MNRNLRFVVVLIVIFTLPIRLVLLSDIIPANTSRIVSKPIATSWASRAPLVVLLQLVAHGFDVFVDFACDTIDASFCELDARAGSREVSGFARGALEAAASDHDWYGCPFDEVV